MICRRDLRLWGFAAAALLIIPAVSAALAAAPGAEQLEAARKAVDAEDGISAEVAARRALDAGVPRANVAALMGEALLLEGDAGGARDWLGPGEFAPAERQRGFHALAQLEIADGNPDAARAAFDKALAAGAGDAALWVDLGRFRYSQGEHVLAFEAANNALEADPEEPRALEFRAQLERDSRGLLAALPWFRRALEAAPDDLDLLGEYAATQGEAGHASDMLKTVRQIIKADGGNQRAFYLQAVLAARAGHDDLARRLLWRTGGSFDQLPAGLLLGGVLEMRMGNAALAVEKFAALARMQPDNIAASLLLGRALLANGEANEVIAQLGTQADRPDASPYLLTLVGRAYEMLDRRSEAAPYLDRAAAGLPQAIAALPLPPGGDLAIWRAGKNGDTNEAIVPLLRQLVAQGDLAQAQTRAAALSASFPGSPDVAVLAGDVAFLSGQPAQALGRYRMARAIRFDRPLALRMVAVLHSLGQAGEARDVLRACLAANPRDRLLAQSLGRAAAEQGDSRAAQLLLVHAAMRGGGSGDPYLLADLASVDLANGDAVSARRAADRAYALQRANGAVARVLARSLAASH